MNIKIGKWSEKSQKFRKSWFKTKVEVGGAIQKPIKRKVEEPKEEPKEETGEETEPV